MQHTSSLPKPSPWSVRAVLADLPTRPQENSSSPLPFFHFLEQLKLEKREGWRRFGIDRGESIADHMYRMSLITMLAPPSLSSRLDMARCTKMALVHDMAEGLVGDLTPVDGVPKPEKSRREAETMDWVADSLLAKVHGGHAGKDIRAVWQEYEDSKTLESQFVHDVDKIELVLQMVEYERASNCSLDLSEFSGVIKRLCLPEMKEWAQEILEEREELWKDNGKEPQGPQGTAARTIQEQQNQYYGNGHVNARPLRGVGSSANSSDDDEEPDIKDGCLSRSLGSLSPSLLPTQDSRWHHRELRLFGYSASVRTPNTAVFRDRLLSRILFKLPFLVEAWYWALIYWVYQLGRAFTAVTIVEGAVHVARKHALQVIQVEKRAHIFWEMRIQRFSMSFPRLMTGINWLYSFIHIPGTIAFLVWLYYYTITSNRVRQTRLDGNKTQGHVSGLGAELYEARRRTMAVCNLLAFVVFTLWPCMPPRLLSDPGYDGSLAEVAKSYDFVDTVHGEGGAKSVWTQNRFCNHCDAVSPFWICVDDRDDDYDNTFGPEASTLEIGASAILQPESAGTGSASILYPLAILVAIISTANHFILDAVAGALVCLIGWKSNAVLVNLLPLEDHFLWFLRIHKPGHQPLPVLADQEIVTVSVEARGEEAHQFKIHKRVLCSHSSRFRDLFEDEVKTKVTTLSEVSVEAFEPFSRWLYTKELAVEEMDQEIEEASEASSDNTEDSDNNGEQGNNSELYDGDERDGSDPILTNGMQEDQNSPSGVVDDEAISDSWDLSSANATEGHDGDALAASSSAPNGETQSAAPTTDSADAPVDAEAKEDAPADVALATEASAAEDAVDANGASALKKSSNGKRKSGGVPEHKNKKANKRKSTATKTTHVDAQPGELYIARLKSYPPWPAVICDEDMLPSTLLNSRPITTKKADGTYNEAYADGGKKAHDRTFPVMFLATNEFAWIHNSGLTSLKAEDCKDVSEKGKNKSLIEAYKIAAEDHELQYFKDLLSAKKRKKAAETDDEVPEKPAKTPKTTKLKLTTNKTPATSEKKSKEKPSKAKTDKRKSKAAATAEDEDMPDAPEAEPEAPVDPEEARKAREREVLFLRHKLQKGFLSRDQAPQEDDMPHMSNFIKKLENYQDLEASIIRATKINKVLKALLKLNTIPKDEEFNFRKRSVELLSKWKILGAEPHDADVADKESKDTPTTNGVNGEALAEDSKLEDGEDKAVVADEEPGQAEPSELPPATDATPADETEPAADAPESAQAETAEAVKTDA
ncbi:hypothetical protein DV736_g25, partial [Chaetothyriales sp. CBS 134916]